ncbi:MAG: hypothetical protein HND50_06900 [Calditrichaeota bacterium]|nr:hypothetical protein [Calditrichota bacterium]
METLIGENLSTSIKKVRINNDKYEELIFLNKESTNLHDFLSQKLGSAINGNPNDGNVMRDTAIEIANSNGGIDDDQFLYGGEIESTKIVLMIWPWQDNEHLTIKKFIV